MVSSCETVVSAPNKSAGEHRLAREEERSAHTFIRAQIFGFLCLLAVLHHRKEGSEYTLE